MSCHPLEDWPASLKTLTKSSARTVMLNIVMAMASVSILTPGLGVMVVGRGIILHALDSTAMRFGGLISIIARNVNICMGFLPVSHLAVCLLVSLLLTNTPGDK